MAHLLVSDPELAERLQRAGHRCDWTPDDLAGDLMLVGFGDGPVSGGEWIRTLSERAPDLPLLAICEDTEQAEQALAAGADDVLRAPFSSAVLSARLRGWLRHTTPDSDGPKGAANLLPRMIEASPDPVVAVDLEGQVLLFSRAAEKVLGYRAAEVVGQAHVGTLYAAAGSASEVMQQLRAAEDHRIHGHSVRLRAKTGEAILVQLSATLVHDAMGRPVASVGIFRDDREREQLSLALERTTDQLHQSEARGGLLDAARAGLAELASPLTEALGRLELAAMDPELSPGARAQVSEAQAPLSTLLRRTRELTERLDLGT
ncbi:MAG: PAS domain S-box protein [Myxococcota bacterium]|nr:PAS domain S-box protein [Myxococcota bacterium]